MQDRLQELHDGLDVTPLDQQPARVQELEHDLEVLDLDAVQDDEGGVGVERELGLVEHPTEELTLGADDELVGHEVAVHADEFEVGERLVAVQLGEQVADVAEPAEGHQRGRHDVGDIKTVVICR